MNAKFYPAKLVGKTEASSLKSIALCYFVASSIAEGQTQIYLKTESEDITILKDAFFDLGVNFDTNKNTYIVTRQKELKDQFYVRVGVKSSMTALRYLVPIISASTNRCEYHGEGKLTKSDIASAFCELKGLGFDSKSLPVYASGKLKSGEYFLTEKTHSQTASALIMALALLDGDSVVIFSEKPKRQLSALINMTIKVMQDFGVIATREEEKIFIKGGQKYIAPSYPIVVGGNYATAGYFLMAKLLGNQVEITNLDNDSLQPEKVIVNYYEKLKDGTAEIDLKGRVGFIYLLVATACTFNRTTTFLGVKIKDKDLDKFNDFISCMNSLGASVTFENQSVIVKGNNNLGAPIMLDTFNDSSLAMTYIVLTTALSAPVTILSVEAGMKEQSTFLNEFRRLGGKCEVI